MTALDQNNTLIVVIETSQVVSATAPPFTPTRNDWRQNAATKGPTPSADAAAIDLRPVLCSICSTLFRDVSRKSGLMKHARKPCFIRVVAVFDPFSLERDYYEYHAVAIPLTADAAAAILGDHATAGVRHERTFAPAIGFCG
jgi:hypothetical protein